MIQFTPASLIHASENIWMAALLINTHHDSHVVCYAFYIKFNVFICWSSFRVSLENTLLEKDMAHVIAFFEWVEWVVTHYRLRENFSENFLKCSPNLKQILIVISNKYQKLALKP